MYNATITSNRANDDGDVSGNGGGIKRTSGTVNLRNTILALNIQNAAGLAVDDDCKGALGQLIYSLIFDAQGCTFTNNHTLTGQYPRLGILANNGGPTQTHALNSDSPAIDAGEPTGCKDRSNNNLTSDQRGRARPVDGDRDGVKACDIGAFEFPVRAFLPLIQK